MKRWYLLYCKRGEQQRAKMHLENQSVECFYPEVCVEKILRGKRQMVQEPLFPSYMFVRFDFRKWTFIYDRTFYAWCRRFCPLGASSTWTARRFDLSIETAWLWAIEARHQTIARKRANRSSRKRSVCGHWSDLFRAGWWYSLDYAGEDDQSASTNEYWKYRLGSHLILSLPSWFFCWWIIGWWKN